jgi:carboxylesterase
MLEPAAPFALGDGPDVCLLLHGLTGVPSDVRPVGEALAQAGLRAVGPVLPGHGTQASALNEVSHQDLEAWAHRELADLRGARRIFICGLSMGGLLALRLAARGDVPVARIALLAPAIRFSGRAWIYTNVVGRLPRLPIVLSADGRDIEDRQAVPGPLDAHRLKDGSYREASLRWGRELRLLSDKALASAPAVRAPALILQGALDHTAATRGARLLAGRLGSPLVTLRIFARSGHVLPLDHDAQAASRAVVEFFQDTAAQ